MNNGFGVAVLLVLLVALVVQLCVGLALVEKRVGQIVCVLVLPELVAWIWLMSVWLAPAGEVA